MVTTSLFNKYNIVGDCWIFSGGLGADGYGIIWHEGVCYRAHRLSYSLSVEPIPKGISVLHKCDNRQCINPEHLFLGTQQDNIDDMTTKGRNPDRKGSNNPSAKLSEAEVIEIIDLLDLGHSQADIAAAYGIGRSTVGHIKRRKNWKHV